MSDADAPPAFDAARLIADIRQGEPKALSQAYRMTFAGDLGRLVLAHHLQECGIGNFLGTDNLKYSAGKHDGALSLALKAGYDQSSLAVGVLTDQLEGTEDEIQYSHRPDPEDEEFLDSR